MTDPCGLDPRPPYCKDPEPDHTVAIAAAISVSAVVFIAICCTVCCCCCKNHRRWFEEAATKEKRKKAEEAFAESQSEPKKKSDVSPTTEVEKQENASQ